MEESEVEAYKTLPWRLAWVLLRLVAVVLLGTASSTFVYRGF